MNPNNDWNEKNWDIEYRPLSLTPLSRRVDAVYYDEPNLCRMPVLALGIFQERAVWKDTRKLQRIMENLVGFVESDREGFIEYSVERMADNFIGYEFDGVQLDWTEEIERYKKKEAMRAGGNK